MVSTVTISVNMLDSGPEPRTNCSQAPLSRPRSSRYDWPRFAMLPSGCARPGQRSCAWRCSPVAKSNPVITSAQPSPIIEGTHILDQSLALPNTDSPEVMAQAVSIWITSEIWREVSRIVRDDEAEDTLAGIYTRIYGSVKKAHSAS